MCVAKLLYDPQTQLTSVYNKPHFCAGFDVGVGAVQILIFLVGAAAVGVGKQIIIIIVIKHATLILKLCVHPGSAGVSYIHISQPTPTYLNCSVEGLVGGQLYVDVPYFLALAGAILCGLSIGIGLLYKCIKSDPCCFRVLYLTM